MNVRYHFVLSFWQLLWRLLFCMHIRLLCEHLKTATKQNKHWVQVTCTFCWIYMHMMYMTQCVCVVMLAILDQSWNVGCRRCFRQALITDFRGWTSSSVQLPANRFCRWLCVTQHCHCTIGMWGHFRNATALQVELVGEQLRSYLWGNVNPLFNTHTAAVTTTKDALEWSGKSRDVTVHAVLLVRCLCFCCQEVNNATTVGCWMSL